jgi:hypothetical protein
MLPKSLATVNLAVSRTDFGADLAIKWNPTTAFEIPASVRAKLGDKRIINGNLTTTGKDLVGRAFMTAFGYPLDVDPKSYAGPVVEKPVANGVHGGRIVEGPIRAPKPNYVYSVLINNVHEGFAEDIRVPIVGSLIPFCYLKYRPERSRFSNVNKHVGLVGSRSVLQEDELEKLLRFASLLNLDYGELDVLRDRNSQRIYVVDANNTPYGPPARLPAMERQIARHLIGSAFVSEFIRR